MSDTTQNSDKNQSQNRQPDYIIHTTNGEQKNAPWHRIGAAWEGKNGYLTANLSATPINGKLIFQPKEELDKLRAQKQNNPSREFKQEV